MRRSYTVARWPVLAFLLSLAGCSGSSDIVLKPVTHPGFEETVQQNKGKVVVVEFWATYCRSCKDYFSRLVELNDKYAGEGLAVISFSLDDPTDLDAQERALRFLKEQKATFTNLSLASNEKSEHWWRHLGLRGIPAIFVYDRDGKRVQEFYGADKYPEVEKLVVQLLKQ
jgi:thioredoxin-like negative regulator of GroEL